MAEEPMEPLPPPKTLERVPRRKPSRWPIVIAVALLVVFMVGSVVMLLREPTRNEPWRIAYPGVEWLRGEDSNTPEGLRYLQAEVRFEQDVLSAADFEDFLAELVKRTDKVYTFYHIRGQNKRGQWVIDGVVGPDTHRTYYGPNYDKQGAPDAAPSTPSEPPAPPDAE